MGKQYRVFPGHPEDEIANVINDVTIRVSDSLRNAGVDLENRPNVIIRNRELPEDSMRRQKREHGHFNERILYNDG